MTSQISQATNERTDRQTDARRHRVKSSLLRAVINPLIATLKPQSNGPSYGNSVIGTLAVDGWAVTFGTAHPPMASVQTSYYSMWHYNCL